MNIQQNKEKLEAEKKLLEEELSSLGRVDKTGDWEATPEDQPSGPEADENDLADREENYEERSGTLAALEARLVDIKKALDQIENGGYDTCDVCGKKIEEDRLEVNPAAHTCKDCMDKVI